MPDNPQIGDKGVCNFSWGPGCADPQQLRHNNHICSLPKGHAGDCTCYDDDPFVTTKLLAAAKV